jgi:hypothetical protein
MALIKKLKKEENEYSIDFDNTYFKIDSIIIEVLVEEIIVSVRGYANEYSRQKESLGIFKKVYTLNFSDLNYKIESFSKNDILKSLYEHIKTLDEFKDAKDC